MKDTKNNNLFIKEHLAQLKDAIYGLAVGDALGLPAESQQRGSYHLQEMLGGGIHAQAPGTWSDDTSMTLATCSSIKNEGTLDARDILRQFRGWLYESRYTANGLCFGYGNTTATAIESGTGQASNMDCGNGSLMRIIPLAFLQVSDSEIEAISAITHAHAIPKQACVIYVRFAQALLAKQSPAEALSKLDFERPFHRLGRIACYDKIDINSGGYVIDTLEAALWCLATTHSYKDCVLAAANLGDDTDTTAAVAGGLAGIVYGYQAIPSAWIATLLNKQLIEACLFSNSA